MISNSWPQLIERPSTAPPYQNMCTYALETRLQMDWCVNKWRHGLPLVVGLVHIDQLVCVGPITSLSGGNKWFRFGRELIRIKVDYIFCSRQISKRLAIKSLMANSCRLYMATMKKGLPFLFMYLNRTRHLLIWRESARVSYIIQSVCW